MIETGAANPQNLGSSQAIAVAHLQNLLDVDLAHLIKGQRLPVLIAWEP
jgi:hypothetical protein